MKLRNKKTGEIIVFDAILCIKDMKNGDPVHLEYNSYEAFAGEWEDTPEEPEIIWYLDYQGQIRSADSTNDWTREKEIGNYFESKEEAEKAVEKLKAWKRLRDKGFKYNKHWGYAIDQPKVDNTVNLELLAICEDEVETSDLDLIFGEEE